MATLPEKEATAYASVNELNAPIQTQFDVPLGQPVESVRLKHQVDSLIERGLVDMWLLLEGEEIEFGPSSSCWQDGRAFAMVMGDQVYLLSRKASAVSALRSVGLAII